MSDPTAHLFARLVEFQTSLQSTNSSNEKIQRCQSFVDLQPILAKIYDPQKVTNLTSANVRKLRDSLNKPVRGKKRKVEMTEEKTSSPSLPPFFTFFDMLQGDVPKTFEGTHEACQMFYRYCEAYKDYEDLLHCLLDKDLNIRMGITQLNKAFPGGLVHVFAVPLAMDMEDKASMTYFEKHQSSTWFLSRKYDGIRCIVRIRPDGTVTIHSREGRLLPALEPLRQWISQKLSQATPRVDVALDGEVCCVDDATGQENFSQAVSQATRKNDLMTNYRYYVFDLIDGSGFDNHSDPTCFSDRLRNLQAFLSRYGLDETRHVVLFDYKPYTEQSRREYDQRVVEDKWEGLMVRRDAPYQATRNKDLLKIKKFHVEEYQVREVFTGPMKVIDPSTGLEVIDILMTAVTIEHKGFVVSVGSGFTLDERRLYKEHPEQIRQHYIGVRYFEESRDKQGNLSLRFPTFLVKYGLTPRQV